MNVLEPPLIENIQLKSLFFPIAEEAGGGIISPGRVRDEVPMGRDPNETES